MAQFGADNFNRSAALGGSTASGGGTWTRHTTTAPNDLGCTGTRVRDAVGGFSQSLVYHSGSPASADYTVQGDVVNIDSTNLDAIGVAGRIDTAAFTFYWAYADYFTGLADTFYLKKYVAGAPTQLGLYSFPDESNRTIKLSMVGTTIAAFEGATQRVSVTDSAIAAAGKAGVWCNGNDASNSLGIHLDNYSADDAVAAAATSAPLPSYSRRYAPLLIR